MNRLVVPATVLALGLGVYFLLSWRPTGGQVGRGAPATEAPTGRLTDAEVPLAPRPGPASQLSAAPASAEAAAPESGPYEVVMGEYKIAMRDSTRRMRMTLVLTVRSLETRRELMGRREQLRRMIHFLSAHRPEETMVGTAGRDRFLSDLKERFANVVRTGPLERMEITTWALEDLPAAPATTPDGAPVSAGPGSVAPESAPPTEVPE